MNVREKVASTNNMFNCPIKAIQAPRQVRHETVDTVCVCVYVMCKCPIEDCNDVSHILFVAVY